jgi:hypothetical protein
MINAYRRTRWSDGVQFGECLACLQRVSDPDVFCTHCGTEWSRCVVDSEYHRRGRRGSAVRCFHSIGGPVHRYEPWIIQQMPCGTGFAPLMWVSRDLVWGPFEAHRILERLRERERQEVPDDRDVFRALPLRKLRGEPDSDGGGRFVEVIKRIAERD